MSGGDNILVFSGNANRPLAQAVCRELGVPMGRALVGKFSDGEVQVEIEENVRNQDVFVIQPTSAPTAEHLMELLALIDALKRASASIVTAVVPYFGYARQDRRPRSARVPITAKVAAKLFSAVDADRVLTVDLPRPCCSPTSGATRGPTTSLWCRRTSAAWCAHARSPSASTTRSWRSSTSAARRRTWPRS
jgi:ribose-phosphate pyrophosphokinase